MSTEQAHGIDPYAGEKNGRQAPEAQTTRGQTVYDPPPHRALLASTPSFFVPPPSDWRHPITGKRGWQPNHELIAFGTYVKRARYLADLTQQRLGELSGVDQGQISRLERGLAPWTRTADLVSIGACVGRALPLGFCPHEHGCQWQPAPRPPAEKDWREKWREAEARYSRTDDDPR